MFQIRLVPLLGGRMNCGTWQRSPGTLNPQGTRTRCFMRRL